MLKYLQQLCLLGTLFLFACSSGGGGTGGNSNPTPNPNAGQLTALSPATIPTGSAPVGIAVTQNIGPNVPNYAYVLNSTDATISMYSINQQTGQLTTLSSPVASVANALQIVINPRNTYVYVATATGILVYSIDNTTGAHVGQLTQVSTTSGGCISLAISPDGEYLYAANSGATTISMYSISPITGALTALSPATVNNSVQPNRLSVTPNGQYLYATYTSGAAGTSVVTMYSINTATGALTALSPATIATGDHPYKMVTHPKSNYTYVLNDSGTVSMYGINSMTGALTALSPATVAVQSPVSMVITPNGNFAYVLSQANSTTIYMYAINSLGQLTALTIPSINIASLFPSDIAITADGKYVYILNGTNKSVGMFAVTPAF